MSYSNNYDEAYFGDYVRNEKERIEKYLEWKKRCVTEEQSQKCDLMLFRLYKNIIYCKCTLRKYFNVEYDSDFDNTVKEYIRLVTNLKHLLPECEKIDCLAIDYLFSDGSDSAYDAFYAKLKELSKYSVYRNLYSSSSGDLRKYMNEQWYKDCEELDFSWYGSHLNSNGVFGGYISFVGSAIAKKCGLNITNIKYLVK